MTNVSTVFGTSAVAVQFSHGTFGKSRQGEELK